LKGDLPELRDGIPMVPCQTGDGRLWRQVVRLDVQGPERGGGGAAPFGLFGGAGAGLGSLGGVMGGAPPPLFECNYVIRNPSGAEVLKEDVSNAETGSLRQFYYHRARFPGVEADHSSDVAGQAFTMFVHEEVHMMQNGGNPRDFIHRFTQLAQAKFAKKRKFLDRAIEELIEEWKGGIPPKDVVLALAATVGYFRRQNQSSFWGEALDQPFSGGVGLGGNFTQGADAKEKEPPPSLIVCRWLVKYCPARQDAEEDDRREGRTRDRGGEGHMGGHQLHRFTQLGMLQALETLYFGEKTFEWLKLLNFLPEHNLPSPLSASQCTSEDREKLQKNYLAAMHEQFDEFRAQKEQYQIVAAALPDEKEKQKRLQALNAHIETYQRGLYNFCPSVDNLWKLLRKSQEEMKDIELQNVVNHTLSRLRTLHFGQADKDAFKSMIRDFAFLQSDDTACALLSNTHHPSEAMKSEEIMAFVRQVTETTRDGARPAGTQLQNAMRRWLLRHYGRQPERSDRKEEKQQAGKMSRGEYQSQKEEIREAMRSAIRGWHMVLGLACFRQEEETVRLILFELSQAYFFKDPDPLLVVDCILELEADIKQCEASGGKNLATEMMRIAVKSVRDSNEIMEDEYDLLTLLFDKPTPLRFYIIEQFIGMRMANHGLENILRNEPIWSRLLSREWKEAKEITEYPLGKTQSTGLNDLERSAKELKNGSISLSKLHTILQNLPVYEKLISTQVGKDIPRYIPGAQEKLDLFDREYQQLRVYAKVFCETGHIDTEAINRMLESIHYEYSQMELSVADRKFERLEVRPHLGWIFEMRASQVFMNIWRGSCSVTEEGPALEKKHEQTTVVGKIIPDAKRKWEALAKSIETGSAILENIKWCVTLDWITVQKELELLERTAPKASAWLDSAIKMTKAMRLAAKLRDWAPAMLHLRDLFGELFKSAADDSDECVKELRTVVRQYEHMWTFELKAMIDQIAPFADTINTLKEPMQDYIIKAAEHDASMEYLLSQKVLEEFNRLISLCRPNTDDAVVLSALAALGQTRTFLSDALYSKPPYKGLREFLKALSEKNESIDETVYSSLEAVQVHYKPLSDLLTTQSRTPGVQACYDLKKISEVGHFVVFCTQKESEQILCKAKDQTFTYEMLSELRRQLLMTDVPAELEGATNLGEMLDELVNKFQTLEEYGRASMELFNLGHFDYFEGMKVLEVAPTDKAASVALSLQELQGQLDEWSESIESCRGTYYYANYFTVRELCHLVRTMPEIGKDDVWMRVWPLLRVVDIEADGSKLREEILHDRNLKSLLATGASSETVRLNAMGMILDTVFQNALPRNRPLSGKNVQSAKQIAAGDMVIRSLNSGEQGTPVFVCCADDPSKVTELVLSIYTRRERVPEAEELLLCSANTTLEQINILLRRFFNAKKQRREDRLYCLGNVHLLPYVVQCGTVEDLRRLEEKFGYDNASALVFVSGLPNQMLTNALNRHNLAVSVLPQPNLREAVKLVGERYHGRPIEAVAAKMNGVGKTHHVYREVCELQKKYGNKPILHHIEIRETTDIASLVAALLNDPTDPGLPTAIHIDLAHILPSHVDTLLFEVLIVGVLRDNVNCAAYHRRNDDFFFVEIPNTPDERTAKQLSFCLLLPRTYLSMTADRIDKEMPCLRNVRESNNAVLVEFKKNENLVLVGKTLAAMKVEAFNPKSKDFQVTWAAARVPEIEVERTYQLLLDVCSSEDSPPSFLVFMNFVKFMGSLIRMAEGWNMMNLQLLQNFDPGLKHFKHCFFRLLIETSRDFALRQVPKAGGIIEDSSPLAPVALTRSISARSPMPGGLVREVSSNTGGLQRAMSRNIEATISRGPTQAEIESGGVGRIDTMAYAKRFDAMPTWESCVHPIASFKKNEMGNIVGCSIMSLSRDFLGNFIDRNLQNSLNLNDLKLERDWRNVTHQEAVQLVHHVEGGEILKKKGVVEQGPKEYVMTVDNLLKIMSIQQRLKYGLPVILMGETGCGKTALVKFLASTLEFKLFTLDIHGGISDEDIMRFLDESVERAGDGNNGALIFFDEINAANCMALFKSIIIDRVYGNKLVPENVRIISCCNPYRMRKNVEDAEVALVFQHSSGDASGIHDPMKKLVYRVHPLPESLIDVVSDFGSLSEKSEELYISAILRKELPRFEAHTEDGDAAAAGADDGSDYELFMNAFKDLLCISQTYTREVNNDERSVVSMRDIARAARVFKWFLEYYSKLQGVGSPVVSDDRDAAKKIQVTTEMRPHLRSAVVLTLGYCYHARLNRDHRWGYRKRICDTWAKMAHTNSNIGWLNLETESEFERILVETQHEFVSQMDRGEGIALNEALRENLFMLLVSVMNQVPILLIGKPGCSKSLAMEVLTSTLNGPVSNKEFFQTMPAVDTFPYQCSPLSTPEAILNAFQQARKSNLHHKGTIVCVLLDEVGLAEESPHLPLKVLHKELEDLQGISCVGISNWALDAAKMSRCVTLYRPPPTVEDLVATAKGMVCATNLEAYLRPLCEAFFEIYKNQTRKDFWGMREFYSTVRVINAAIKERTAKGLPAALESDVLMKTVQRNFGGCSEDDLDICIGEFFFRSGMDEDVDRFSTTELIMQNLVELDARHLMLLTKNNAALRLLFESNLLDHGKAEVMFGSTFPNDQSDVFVAMNLQRIKSYMQQPISLVMVHCDSLYESLYDLLNQHYMEYAGQRYVRIAHGSKAKQCPIHKQFRVIVITEISDAYFRLAAPLLNRFEKQIFLRKDIMQEPDTRLLKQMQMFWERIQEMTNAKEEELVPEQPPEPAEEEEEGSKSAPVCKPVAGYHAELLSSLVFSLRRKPYMQGKSPDETYIEARRLFVRVMTPEAICILAAKLTKVQMESKFGFDIVEEYFEKQHHSDLPSFAESLMGSKESWCDDWGAQSMVMTYSPIRGKIGQDLKGLTTPPKEISLHELSSSTDIEKAIEDFYKGCSTNKEDDARFLIIHADPVAASVRMIEHCRFVCEKQRKRVMHEKPSLPGQAFVILVVHLQRGIDGNFSFDFDSQWDFVFSDSVEPADDLGNMPKLGDMLNMPLIKVISGLNFPNLLRQSFRSALSRLIYPHTRTPQNLQEQIQMILSYLDDEKFVQVVRDWTLQTLRDTPKKGADGITVGQDTHWFAAIATAAHELALAGTFRAALHNRITILLTSLLTALLAHLDRNGGLALLAVPEKRDYWLVLSTASLLSPLSFNLETEKAAAIEEKPTTQHEVGTDAHTPAKPFTSKFPFSWFISRNLTEFRQASETAEKADKMTALSKQYEMSMLKSVGLDPKLEESLLHDYLEDFTAMHLDWTSRISRKTQTRIVTKMLQRFQGGKLTSILEIHHLFWNEEKQIAYCINLLNAVQEAIPDAEKLIEESDMEGLNLDLLLLVHKTLASELLRADIGSGHVCVRDFYRDWLARKQVVAGLTKDFLDGVDGSRESDLLSQLKSIVEPRVETLALVLQHVAYPLNLPAEIVRDFAEKLPTGKIRSAETLLALFKLLENVIGAAEEAAALGHCCQCTESWILDVCLRDPEATNDLDEYALKLFCQLAAGLPLVTDSHTTGGITAGAYRDDDEAVEIVTVKRGVSMQRSPCLNLALLRKLIVHAEGATQRKAQTMIFALLKDVGVSSTHNDTTFATKYAVLCEEAAGKELSKCASCDEWPDMSLPDVFGSKDPAKMLQDVGYIRWMLTRYAGALCEDPIRMDYHDRIVNKVNNLLMTEDPMLMPVCRSMRLFLLKCIERNRGVSFLRGLLAMDPAKSTEWVIKWRVLNDIDFERFVGAALVPKWNPFKGGDETEEYTRAKVVIQEVMTSTSCDKLNQYSAEVWKKGDKKQQKRDIGGLILALCQEPGLYAALEVPGMEPPFRFPLSKWLAEPNLPAKLPVTYKEQMLLRIFSGDFSSLEKLKEAEALKGLSVCKRNMDDLLKWRVLGHLASALISAPPSSLMAALRTLMLEPHELCERDKYFIPGMDEDIRNRVMKALLERGENIWKFKSHWYKCSCGYTFFIGECGRPMEVASCPSCKVQIGGRDHSKTHSTKEDDESDRSPAGYMLPQADKDEKHVSFREIPSVSARCIRLLLHGAMLLGIAADAPVDGEKLNRIFAGLVNPDSMCTMNQYESEAKYIFEHFENDFKQLFELLNSNTEDLAVALHAVLMELARATKDEPKPIQQKEHGLETKAAEVRKPFPGDWCKLDMHWRNNWEESLEFSYLVKFQKNFEDQVKELYMKWGDPSEDGKFVSELKETADVKGFPARKRQEEMPQVWAYRSAVTLDALHRWMGYQRDLNERLPVLVAVLHQQLFPVLQALGCLTGVFEWHSLIMGHYSGRLSREQAGKLTVSEVLDARSSASERARWARAFDRFQEAWRIAWPHIRRFECLEIPEAFHDMVVDRHSAMLWCIADRKDEGICPLALTQFLVERHNEVVQVVSNFMNYPQRKVSSRLLGQHDVINYTGEDLQSFLHNRCVTYGNGGKLNFDLSQLENQLRREMSRPEITMEIREFQWLGESMSSSAELKSVIKQRDLTPDVIERIKRDIGNSARANLCLQKVQMSVSFILKSGRSLSDQKASEMLLSEYMRSVLSESSDSLPSATAQMEVHLYHVDAFSRLLKQIINKDPMDMVDAKYKVAVPKEIEDQLKEVKSKLPNTLCDVMGSFAEGYLAEGGIGEDYSILDVIMQFFDSKEETSAITENMPSGLYMKHWASVYKIMKG